MATPKSIICQGITYGSVLELAERFGIHPSTVARRLRDGWTPEAAVGVDAKPKRQGHGTSVTYKGKQYPHFSSVPTLFRGDRADLTRNPTLNFLRVA